MSNEKIEINFKDLFVNMLGRLSEREQEVLRHRYQLTSDLEKKATLKQIGDNYNITRERVRQIEKDAVRKFVQYASDKEFNDSLKNIEDKLIQYITKKGGLVREDHLLDDFIKRNFEVDFFHTNAYLFVFDNLFNSIARQNQDEHFLNVWYVRDLQLDKVRNLLDKLVKELEQLEKVQEKAELLELAKKHSEDELRNAVANYLVTHQAELEDFLHNYIQASNKIEDNILGQWGLNHWHTIRPKKLGDKIHLIFNKSENPLHFRAIAEKINEANFDHKKICPATVHNELIANDRYILIGRGIYALKDWGYSEGTVADIIESILKKAAKPLSKKDIYNEVLKQRKVNESTIYLTLINKDQFKKTEAGEFILQ